MSIPEICVRRPVFTTMLILMPVIMGIMAYSRMGVDLFPNVEFPTIVVTVSRPGASVDEMEIGVTKKIEDVVNQVSGIDELRSVTKEGLSIVTVQFVLEKSRDIAQQEVQGKVNTIISQLPTGTQTPLVDKFDLDALPVMTIAVSGKRSMREITELADKQVREALSGLSGVGTVTLVGGEKRAVNVTVDTGKLEAYGLSIDDVRQALQEQNIELPGGRVDQSGRELVLRTMGRIDDVRDFNNIVVARRGDSAGRPAGQVIHLRDLGRGMNTAVDTSEERRAIGRLDGQDAVFLVVQKQSGVNSVDVINNVKSRVGGIRAALAAEGKADVNLKIIRDTSLFITSSLHEVNKSLVIGVLLVSATILLFLRDWRTMIIAGISIPVSLVSTFLIMWMMGMTLNQITMLALVLAIGIVIDDAVVVHENIFRWMEEKGHSAWTAALGATKEIALAVMATTFSLVVIFLPIAFMSGRVGRWFSSFGITCAVAILVSLVVSFTLTPMLCSRFLRLSKKAKEEGKAHHSGGIYGWLVEKPYLASLRWGLRRRWVIILATVLVTMSMFPLPLHKLFSFGNANLANKLSFMNYPGLFALVGNDFLPKDDQSEFEMTIQTPEGWSLKQTDDTFREIERKLDPMRKRGMIENIVTTIGDTTGKNAKGEGDVTQGTIYVKLIDLEERGKNGKPQFDQFSAMAEARQILKPYTDLRTGVQIPSAFTNGARNSDISYDMVGPDLHKLIDYSQQIADSLRAEKGFTDVDTSIALRKPELHIIPNRERMADQDVSIQSLSSAMGILVGGQIVSDFKDSQLGEQYDVWLRAQAPFRSKKSAIENLTVPARAGLVRISAVADLAEDRGPSLIERFMRQRKVTVMASLDGLPVDKAAAIVAEKVKLLNNGPGKPRGLPEDYQLIPAGKAKIQNESNAAFAVAFLSSLLFMYMILAAQFESFVLPIVILMAVPITIPFALLSLLFLGQPLTLYSILGLFLLFGIVKKNGILQVDYTNILRQRAKENAAEVAEEFANPPLPRKRGWLRGWRDWMAGLPEPKRTRLWAVIEANRTRLRPILMTTMMLVAAMVPIALAQGPGAGNRSSMAKVIVGGQALSLLLSLLVTPVAYTLFDDFGKWTRRRFGKKKTVVETMSVDPTAPLSGAAQPQGETPLPGLAGGPADPSPPVKAPDPAPRPTGRPATAPFHPHPEA